MNKRELVARLASRTGLSQVKCLEVINALFDADAGIIAGELDEGNKVSVPGFGTWNVRVRPPRTGTNPKSQVRLSIPARRFTFFRAGKNLRDRISKG